MVKKISIPREKIGNLYITNGGRVVLDKGFGEYFNDSDLVLFTKDELTRGIFYEDFMEKVRQYHKRSIRV